MIALLRERNESAILQGTLDHLAALCDEGIIVYDDASTDGSEQLAHDHEAVRRVIVQEAWRPGARPQEETRHRYHLVREAHRAGAKWALFLDADERLELEGLDLEELTRDGHDGLICRLWDAYLTPEDCAPFAGDREWWGPEYRLMVPIFEIGRWLRYWRPDQRNVWGPARPFCGGSIRHYGKAVSVEEWDATCDYYARYWPKYAAKWAARRGKAVHAEGKSDFGAPLMRWDERHEKGVFLR